MTLTSWESGLLTRRVAQLEQRLGDRFGAIRMDEIDFRPRAYQLDVHTPSSFPEDGFVPTDDFFTRLLILWGDPTQYICQFGLQEPADGTMHPAFLDMAEGMGLPKEEAAELFRHHPSSYLARIDEQSTLTEALRTYLLFVEKYFLLREEYLTGKNRSAPTSS